MTSMVATLAVTLVGGNSAMAVAYPYTQDYSSATLGNTRSPYNGTAGSGVNESTLPENPTGWLDGPPVTASSNASPWSIANVGGANGNYLRFSGANKFDGNGRGYTSVAVTGVPTTVGTGWTTSIDLKFDALTIDGTLDTFRFGVGALGANPLFASGTGGSAGGTSFYFADAGFTVGGVGASTALADQALTFRVFRFGGAGNVELTSATIAAGYLNTTDDFRMTISGLYGNTGLTLSATLDNLTTASADLVSITAPVETAPLSGTYFGLRHSSGAPASANQLATLDFRQDNFSVTVAAVPEPATLALMTLAACTALRRRMNGRVGSRK